MRYLHLLYLRLNINFRCDISLDKTQKPPILKRFWNKLAYSCPINIKYQYTYHSLTLCALKDSRAPTIDDVFRRRSYLDSGFANKAILTDNTFPESLSSRESSNMFNVFFRCLPLRG